MDDRAGVAAALAQGFEVTGTLGVLVRATAQGLIDLPTAFGRLRTTHFRCRPELMDGLLSRYAAARRDTKE